jgi:hypothetical protein
MSKKQSTRVTHNSSIKATESSSRVNKNLVHKTTMQILN